MRPELLRYIGTLELKVGELEQSIEEKKIEKHETKKRLALIKTNCEKMREIMEKYLGNRAATDLGETDEQKQVTDKNKEQKQRTDKNDKAQKQMTDRNNKGQKEVVDRNNKEQNTQSKEKKRRQSKEGKELTNTAESNKKVAATKVTPNKSPENTADNVPTPGRNKSKDPEHSSDNLATPGKAKSKNTEHTADNVQTPGGAKPKNPSVQGGKESESDRSRGAVGRRPSKGQSQGQGQVKQPLTQRTARNPKKTGASQT